MRYLDEYPFATLRGESINKTYIYTKNNTARIWLFGSRVDDHKRGGDIDLLIETEETDVRRIVKTELAFMVKLQMQLGEQKIDVLVDYPSRKVIPPIVEVAKQTGILL